MRLYIYLISQRVNQFEANRLTIFSTDIVKKPTAIVTAITLLLKSLFGNCKYSRHGILNPNVMSTNEKVSVKN